MGDETAPQYKVFVGGLTWDLTNEQLQDGKGVRAGPLHEPSVVGSWCAVLWVACACSQMAFLTRLCSERGSRTVRGSY